MPSRRLSLPRPPERAAVAVATALLVAGLAAASPARAGPGAVVALASWTGPIATVPARSADGGPATLLHRRLPVEPGVRHQLRLVFAGTDGAAAPRLLVRIGEASHRVRGRPDGRWASITLPVPSPADSPSAVDIEVASLDGPVAVAEPSLEPLGDLGSVPVTLAGLVGIGWLLNRRRTRPLLPSLVPR